MFENNDAAPDSNQNGSSNNDEKNGQRQRKRSYSKSGQSKYKKGGNRGGRWYNRHRGGGGDNSQQDGERNREPQNRSNRSSDFPVYQETQLRKLALSFLQSIAKSESVRHYLSTPRKKLIVEIVKQQLRRGAKISSVGILEATADHHGYLRSEANHLQAQHSDPFIPIQMMRQHKLYAGLSLEVGLRQPRSGDKHLVVNEIVSIENDKPESVASRKGFESLTALFPEDRLFMEMADDEDPDLSRRVIDLITPIGKGQRGIIVAPPRVGKTILMKRMVQSIEKNHPECTVIVLLIDERPEEVTDMQNSIQGTVIASTFDEKSDRHIQVAETALNRARVLVENGKDVILFLDSITRLTRAYNNQHTTSSKTLSGGIESAALQKTKRFFGTARNIENGGSLTILGTALIQTGGKMDTVIFEEFKGTGNMELYLDREIAANRIYPAVNFQLSGTRKDDLLMSEDEYVLVSKIRQTLASMQPLDAISHLIDKLRKFKTNAEFLMKVKTTLAGNNRQ